MPEELLRGVAFEGARVGQKALRSFSRAINQDQRLIKVAHAMWVDASKDGASEMTVEDFRQGCESYADEFARAALEIPGLVGATVDDFFVRYIARQANRRFTKKERIRILDTLRQGLDERASSFGSQMSELRTKREDPGIRRARHTR